VIRDLVTVGPAIWVLLWMQEHCDRDGKVQTVTLQTIARDIEKTRDSVREHIRRLEELGILTRQHFAGSACTYRLLRFLPVDFFPSVANAGIVQTLPHV
jgi:hypothetical protein